MNRKLLGLVLASSMPFLPHVARAQDAAPAAAEAPEADARTLFQQGQTAYTQGDPETAVARWTRAYELDPRPLLQFNLSQAYERLGRLDEALRALELYLEHADPQDPHQADARARSAALRERVNRTGVRIQGGPEGATILVDGEDRGRTPRPDPLSVTPGSHEIIVRAPGYDDFVTSVVVVAGHLLDVNVRMQEDTSTAAAGPSASVQASSSSDAPIVPIVLFSAGGAAVVAGAVMGAVAYSDAQNAPTRTGPEADSARTLALVGDITMGVGVAAAVAGLVVLLVDDGDSDDQRVTVAPWGAPTGGGLSVAGRF